jgi:hypothetical protein
MHRQPQATGIAMPKLAVLAALSALALAAVGLTIPSMRVAADTPGIEQPTAEQQDTTKKKKKGQGVRGTSHGSHSGE